MTREQKALLDAIDHLGEVKGIVEGLQDNFIHTFQDTLEGDMDAFNIQEKARAMQRDLDNSFEGGLTRLEKVSEHTLAVLKMAMSTQPGVIPISFWNDGSMVYNNMEVMTKEQSLTLASLILNHYYGA
jgi:hypothetical protein